MTGQSPKGIFTIYSPAGVERLPRSGLYKVYTRTKSPYPYLYAYYNKKEHRWYDANGRDISNSVISFFNAN